MFAIVLCALAASADVEPASSKEPPRLLLVKLDGDQLVYRATVYQSVPVQVTEEFDDNGKKATRTVTRYVTQARIVEQKWDAKKATITTAGGKKLDLDALKKRLAKPQVVVVSGDYKAVDETYLKVLDKDAIVIVPELPKEYKDKSK